MEIIIARSAGFCFGVRRAINLAHECAEGSDSEIFTIGPIIHNPQVVKKLEASHIIAKEGIDEVEEGTVIIRSHGVTQDVSEKAVRKGLNLIDATCPFVKKAQELVGMLSKENYSIVVVGEKEHPEVKGIISYCNEVDVTVAGSIEDVMHMPRKKKIGIIAQTTQPMSKLRDIATCCIEKANEIRVFNTICSATALLQGESLDLADKVDCLIVVGGRNSANTNRLSEICSKIQPRTYHIEVAEELDPLWFDEIDKVGVTAGASTPEWIIDDIVKQLRIIHGNKNTIHKQ